MNYVFVLQHDHEIDEDNEDVKFIGVYSTHEKAEEAVKRLITQPGFRDTQEGFSIDKYDIDKDNWCEGYFNYTYPKT
jgi:hypothetical protein